MTVGDLRRMLAGLADDEPFGVHLTPFVTLRLGRHGPWLFTAMPDPVHVPITVLPNPPDPADVVSLDPTTDPQESPTTELPAGN